MSVGVLPLPGPRVTDLAGRGGPVQPGDNNDFILPSWERGCGSQARQLESPTLYDQNLMKHLPYVQVVPGRNGPARRLVKALAVDSSLLP